MHSTRKWCEHHEKVISWKALTLDTSTHREQKKPSSQNACNNNEVKHLHLHELRIIQAPSFEMATSGAISGATVSSFFTTTTSTSNTSPKLHSSSSLFSQVYLFSLIPLKQNLKFSVRSLVPVEGQV